jgi:hypothetical protein
MKRRAGRYIKVALALGLLASPALAEAHARQQIDTGLSARGVQTSSVDIGPLGLRASGLVAELGGQRIRLGELAVRPSLDGLVVRVDGVELLGATDRTPDESRSTPNRADQNGSGLWQPVERARSLARRFGGIPVDLEVTGAIELAPLSPRPALVDATVERLHVKLESNGQVEGELSAEARLSDTPYQLELDFGSTTTQLSALRANGHLSAPKLGQIEVRVEAARNDFAARIELENGRMELKGQGLLEPAKARAEVSFSRFPVGGVTGFVDGRMQELGVDVDWESLKLDGEAELTRQRAGWHSEIREMTLEGLSIESRHLSRQRVRFDKLGLDADLRLHDGNHSAVLAISHGAASVQFSGNHSADGLDLRAELAPLGCQEFIDAAPRGLFQLLEGMQVAGELEGDATLSLNWETLHTWVAEQEAAKHEGRMPNEEVPEPGHLEFEFPLLESCRVVREAPGLSVAKIKGAHRHRFTGANGHEYQRVLAPGAPNFAPMVSSQHFSRAFTILEDARFWVHDGFDREHIERALWHDLSVGAMARGASTITQQTARNLWLGIQRSASRKLQEAFLAARLEKEVGKRRIMEIYMNIIELGPEVYGIEQASHFYFGRPARDLNLLEALHIASLAPSPVRLARRFESGRLDEEWRAHLEEQVRRLRIHGFLTREQAREARRMKVELLPRAAAPN